MEKEAKEGERKGQRAELGVPLAAMAAARKHAHLTEEELSEFREIFNLVDLDKGGTISKDELKQLMTTLGLWPSQEELNAMVDEIDADGNGEIDFDEFVTVMSRKVNTSYTPAQVKAAFKVFERDAPSGFVTMAALEQARPRAARDRMLAFVGPRASAASDNVKRREKMCAGAHDVWQREALAERRAGAALADRAR